MPVGPTGGRVRPVAPRRSALILIAALALLASFLIGWALVRYRARRERAQVETRLNRLADQGVRLLREWWLDQQEQAATIADTYSLVDLGAARPVALRRRGNVGGTSEPSLEGAQAHPTLALLDIAKPGFVTTDSLLELLPATQEALARVRETGALQHTSPFPLPPDSALHVDILAPIRPRDAEGPPTHALLMRVDIRSGTRTLFANPVGSEEYVILWREGNRIAAANELRYPEVRRFPVAIGEETRWLPAMEAAQGGQGVFHGLDYRGVPVVAAFRATGVLELGLVAKVDEAEAYRSLKQWRTRVVLVALIELLLLGLVGITVWRIQRAAHLRRKAEWDAQGTPVHFVAQIEDMTEGRRAQEGIVASHATQQAVLASLRDLLLIADSTGKIEGILTPHTPLLGRPTEDLVGRSLDEALKTTSASSIAQLVSRSLREGTTVIEVVEAGVGAGTTCFEIAASPLRLPTAREETAVVLLRDVTEQSAMIAGIRASEQRYRALLDNVQLAAVGLDREGYVTYVNPFLERLLGVPKEEVVGTLWIDQYVPERSRDSVRHLFTSMTADEVRSADLEHTISTKSAGERLVRWSSTTVYDASGTVAGTIGIGEDVTDLRTADEALRNRQRGLEVFYAISQAIGKASSLEEMLHAALRETLDATRFDAGTIRLREGDAETFSLAAHERVAGDFAESMEQVGVGESPAFGSFMDGHLVVMTADDVMPESSARAMREHGIESVVVVPVSEGGRVVGALNLISFSRACPPPEQE